MINLQTHFKPLSNINLHGVSLGDIIRASSRQFYFSYINNDSSSVDYFGSDTSTGGGDNGTKIITNLYKSNNISPADILQLVSISQPCSTSQTFELTIDEKLYHRVNTTFISFSYHNSTHF